MKRRVPLLAPNQDIYLRENIRSRLLVAAQAVPRHQEETWKQSLDNVSTWVRAYYDTDDATTKAFLDEVDKLSQHYHDGAGNAAEPGVAGKTDADPSAQPDGAACRLPRAARLRLPLRRPPPLRRKESNAC